MTVLVLATSVMLFRHLERANERSRCGWTVQGDVVLDRDVVDCDHHGVRLAPFANLDCAGHEIRAQEGGASGYGLRFDGVEQALARNCRITGFARGVRIRGGRDNSVVANEITDSGYGIEVAGATDGGASDGHRIAGNQIRASARDVIHLGSGTSNVRLESNLVDDTGEEGITIEACRGCEVRGNSVTRTGSAGLDLENSSGGRYVSNTIRDSLVKIRGRSERNVFEDNQLVRSGYVLAATDGDPGGEPGVPRYNRIVGGSVRESKVCFRFRGARDNVIADVEIDGCREREDRAVAGIEPSDNHISGIDRTLR